MRSSVVILSWLLFANTVRADGDIRQPPTLRDAAQAHFRDGRAFFQTEQFGPAIVEFRAAWELSGERDRRVGTRRRAGLRRSVSEGLSPNPTCPFR